MRVDLNKYPLLDLVSQDAQWKEKDEFPAWEEWAVEHEKWLSFTKKIGALDLYLPRLKGIKEQRDEAFAEISSLYFLVEHCKLRLLEMEPVGGDGNKKGEALLELPGGGHLFVEVKSPGWEAEKAKCLGRNHPRLQLPKYITEAASTEPWAPIRFSVSKAYPKFPDEKSTLLVVNDDLILSPDHFNMDIALYCPRQGSHTTGYLAQDGCFVGKQFERLGAVGIFQVTLSRQIEYKFTLYDNPNSLEMTKVPQTIFKNVRRYNGHNFVNGA